MEYKLCKHCDTQNNSSALYCTGCHKSLKDASKTVTASDAKGVNRTKPVTIRSSYEIVSVGEWLVLFLVFFIVTVVSTVISSLTNEIFGAILSLTAIIVIALKAPKESMRNYCIALLILIPIAIVLGVLLKGCSRCVG